MSDALRILHGEFGRVALILVDKPMAIHAHRVCHVIFKVGGAAVDFGIREREHRLDATTVLLVNAWEPHFYEKRQFAPPATLLALYLEPDWLKKVDGRFSLSAHPRFFGAPALEVAGKIAGIRDELLDMLAGREAPTARVVEDAIASLITELATKARNSSELSPCELMGGVAYDSRIRHSIEHMQLLRGIEIDFDDVARSTNLSRPHFFYLFRKQTGMTPATFASMLRMEASIANVSTSDDSLLDIALKLGFESPGNFTRFFIAQQGVTPSQYRRKIELVSPTVR
jgi:AraC family transcriptional regulator